MRHFNLKEALDGKPVRTKGGMRVEKLCRFQYDSIYNLFGTIEGVDGVLTWTDQGVFSAGTSHRYDLVMDEPEITLDELVNFGFTRSDKYPFYAYMKVKDTTIGFRDGIFFLITSMMNKHIQLTGLRTMKDVHALYKMI